MRAGKNIMKVTLSGHGFPKAGRAVRIPTNMFVPQRSHDIFSSEPGSGVNFPFMITSSAY